VLKANERKICRKAQHKGHRLFRKETTLMIRKQKNDLKLKKRRDTSSLKNISRVSDFKAVLLSTNPTEQDAIAAMRDIRQLSSDGNDLHINEIVNAGLIFLLVQILNCSVYQNSNLIYETAWALSNIAATDYATHVANAGAIKPLVRLLLHTNAKVREQSAWCLGNIAGQGHNLRDQILNESILQQSLLANLVHPNNMSLLGTIVFTISNLCKGNPSPFTTLTNDFVYPLVALLDKPITEEITMDVLWAISYLSNGDGQQIGFVIASGVLSKLIKFIANKFKCKMPIIQILGNLASGSDSQTQVVLDSGILNHLAGLLSSKSTGVRKYSSLLAANIACGNHEQITTLVERRRILRQLIVIATHDRWDVREEALWTLAHICTSGTRAHILSLVRAKGFEPLIGVLALENSNIALLVIVLDAIKNIFEADGQHLCLFEQYKGIDYLEELQKHPSGIVFDRVVYLIENFYGVEEVGVEEVGVEEGENLAPEQNASCHFSFGFAERAHLSPKNLFTNNQKNEFPKEQSSFFGRISTNNHFRR